MKNPVVVWEGKISYVQEISVCTLLAVGVAKKTPQIVQTGLKPTLWLVSLQRREGGGKPGVCFRLMFLASFVGREASQGRDRSQVTTNNHNTVVKTTVHIQHCTMLNTPLAFGFFRYHLRRGIPIFVRVKGKYLFQNGEHL